jgi:hypothetical protein
VAVVLDGFSRRIVGWSMAEHLRTELVPDAPLAPDVEECGLIRWETGRRGGSR